MEEFGANVDDSSDEEQEDNVPSLPPPLELFHSLLAYVSIHNYYYGVLIYHAPQVAAIYYSSKKRLLSVSEIPGEEKIEEWLLNVVAYFVGLSLHHTAQERASSKFVNTCLESIEDPLQVLTESCLKHFRDLVRVFRYGVEMPAEIRASIQELNQAITEFINNDDNFEVLAQNDFDFPRLRINPANLLSNLNISLILEQRFNAELTELQNFHQWMMDNNKIPNNGNIPVNKKAKDGYRLLLNLQLTLIQQGYVNGLIALHNTTRMTATVFLAHHRKFFLEGMLEQMIALEEAKGINSILQQKMIPANSNIHASAFAAFADHLSEFIYWDARHFMAETRKKTINVLPVFIDILKNDYVRGVGSLLSRSTLPTLWTHPITTVPEYIASLRLTNRSMVRVSRNQTQPLLGGPPQEENIDTGWKFPASDRHLGQERTRITVNGARVGFVAIHTNENSYAKIIPEINEFKRMRFQFGAVLHPITDQDIGIWLRQILCCKPLVWGLAAAPDNEMMLYPKQKHDLMIFLIKLAHLLGGTECMRYPGAFIQIQMVLDLIINGIISWETALNSSSECYFPMAVTGAVDICRQLSEEHKRYALPFTHNYPGNNTTTVETSHFMQAESKLSAKWFGFFQKTHNTVKAHHEAVEIAIPEWYPGITLPVKKL